jgi:hypothetical protein
MKTKTFFYLLLISAPFMNIIGQTNATSTQSGGLNWIIQSGYYMSSPSEIVLTGSTGLGGSVLIQSANGSGGVGNITLNAIQGPILFSTNGTTRMTLNNNGTISATGTLSAGSFSTSGAITGGSFTTNGNMGIGTSSPSGKLDIEASNATGLYINQTATGDYSYGIKTIVNRNLTKGIALANTLTNTDVFYVYGSGQVNANGFNSNGGLISANNIGTWGYGFNVKATSDSAKAFCLTNKNNNEIFYVWGNGIVNAKKVYAQAFEVRPDAIGIFWFDHVFAPEYKLKSLADVEHYIKENKHLPDIPSEQKIKTEGFNMGEMDGLLLKKIEELTLYVIQQQKEIEQLKQQISNNNQ